MLFKLFNRRSPLKRSRWRSYYRLLIIAILLFTFSSFLISFFYSILIFQTNFFEPESTNIIISLTSTPARFHHELPLAIHSLLSQTLLPKQIRIYLSPTSQINKHKNITLNQLKEYIENLDSSEYIKRLFDKLVEIRLEEEDYGPATKFLPIITEFQSKSQAIMICDDDQYYHPYTLATLNEYSTKYPDSIIGFRGWRVRKDLIWGVGGKYEMAYHIIESQYLTEVYRVGVLTATYAYLIRPSFFDSHIYLDFNQAPEAVRRVDDIWLNAYASKRNIPRYVIPSCCSHIDITQTHVLEEYFVKNQMDRFSANNHALYWFRRDWENDLWYRFGGANRPNYRSWWLMIYREWIRMIFNLKFIVYFGLL